MFIKIDIKSKVLSSDDENFSIFEDEGKYYLLKGKTMLPLKEGYSFLSKTYDIYFSLSESPKARPEKILPFEVFQKEDIPFSPLPAPEAIPDLHFLQETVPSMEKRSQKTFSDFLKG